MSRVIKYYQLSRYRKSTFNELEKVYCPVFLLVHTTNNGELLSLDIPIKPNCSL